MFVPCPTLTDVVLPEPNVCAATWTADALSILFCGFSHVPSKGRLFTAKPHERLKLKTASNFQTVLLLLVSADRPARHFHIPSCAIVSLSSIVLDVVPSMLDWSYEIVQVRGLPEILNG